MRVREVHTITLGIPFSADREFVLGEVRDPSVGSDPWLSNAHFRPAKAVASAKRTAASMKKGVGLQEQGACNDAVKEFGYAQPEQVGPSQFPDRNMSLERLATKLSDKNPRDSPFVQQSQEKHTWEVAGVKLAHASLLDRVDFIELLIGNSTDKHRNELLVVKGAHATDAAQWGSLAQARHARVHQ